MITLFDPNTDIDLGTPARESQVQVTVNIDGRSISVPEGTSVMRAAALLGTTIPKLCATDSLEAFGSCRMCLVEIDGMRGYPASCTTPVSEGMSVHTQTPKLATLRRNVMELYISDHPLDCLTCSANGNCELQTVAGQVGLREVRYGYEGENHLADQKDTSNPYFDYDPSKCIVCNRCVRACEETQGTFALTITGRGFESRVAAAGGDNFLDSECVSCGACVQACPTATLMEKKRGRTGSARTQRDHHVCLLRRGLLVPRRDERRPTGAHGSRQERPGQPRPLLRQRALCLGLRHPPGSHHQADDPQAHQRPLAGSQLG